AGQNLIEMPADVETALAVYARDRKDIDIPALPEMELTEIELTEPDLTNDEITDDTLTAADILTTDTDLLLASPDTFTADASQDDVVVDDVADNADSESEMLELTLPADWTDTSSDYDSVDHNVSTDHV